MWWTDGQADTECQAMLGCGTASQCCMRPSAAGWQPNWSGASSLPSCPWILWPAATLAQGVRGHRAVHRITCTSCGGRIVCCVFEQRVKVRGMRIYNIGTYIRRAIVIIIGSCFEQSWNRAILSIIGICLEQSWHRSILSIIGSCLEQSWEPAWLSLGAAWSNLEIELSSAFESVFTIGITRNSAVRWITIGTMYMTNWLWNHAIYWLSRIRCDWL